MLAAMTCAEVRPLASSADLISRRRVDRTPQFLKIGVAALGDDVVDLCLRGLRQLLDVDNADGLNRRRGGRRAAAPRGPKAQRAVGAGCCWALAAVASRRAAPAARIVILRMDIPFHRLANGHFGVTRPPHTGNGIRSRRSAGHSVAIMMARMWSAASTLAASREQLLMAKISRSAYAQMFGPTTGDQVRLADTELFIEVEKDFTVYGEEVKFGGGKVIRDGMGQSQVARAAGAVDTVITNALIVDATRHLQGRYRPEGRPHRGDRQGRQSGHASRRHHHRRPGHRGDRRRRQDPHRRRHGRAYPFHLPAADRGSADVGHHHHARRRHRPGARHAGDDLHARPVASGAHDPVLRRLSR